MNAIPVTLARTRAWPIAFSYRVFTATAGRWTQCPARKLFARKALQIDPLLGEAHCSLAMIENAWEWNSRQCRAEFRRCLDLNPSYAMAISKYATSYLSPICRLEEAAEWLERALALDPLSPLCTPITR